MMMAGGVVVYKRTPRFLLIIWCGQMPVTLQLTNDINIFRNEIAKQTVWGIVVETCKYTKTLAASAAA